MSTKHHSMPVSFSCRALHVSSRPSGNHLPTSLPNSQSSPVYNQLRSRPGSDLINVGRVITRFSSGCGPMVSCKDSPTTRQKKKITIWCSCVKSCSGNPPLASSPTETVVAPTSRVLGTADGGDAGAGAGVVTSVAVAAAAAAAAVVVVVVVVVVAVVAAIVAFGVAEIVVVGPVVVDYAVAAHVGAETALAVDSGHEAAPGRE